MSKPKVSLKLGTSGSLESMRKVIAEFYVCKPDRITFVDHHMFWGVKSGEKEVTPIVIQDGKRFVFGRQ